MIFWICLWSWVSLPPSDTTRSGRSRYPAPGRMSPFRSHKIVSVAPKDFWDFFGSTWPSANSAPWAVAIVFAPLEKGVALRRLLYVWFDFRFLSSATVGILTATHRTTPWVCQSIRVLAAVAESCGSSFTRSTSVQFPWRLEALLLHLSAGCVLLCIVKGSILKERLEPILRSPLQMITTSSAWSTTFTAWHFTTAHSSLVQFVLCGVGAGVSHR